MAKGRHEDQAELFDFVDEFEDDRDAGREHDVEHYVARFPELADAVREEFARLTATASDSAEVERSGSGEERRLGPYRLLRELGRGGQGAVFAAEDTRLGRAVALKVLPRSFAILSDERRKRLQREAEIVARLDHPGICTVYEAQVDGDTPYIAMRLVEGSPLSALIAAEVERRSGGAAPGARPAGELPVGPRDSIELRELLAFFERTARALHAAHEAGVVHRDVKPANVMVTPDGEPVVLDFGQAKEVDSAAGLTASGEVFGTPAYMSPEQLEAAPEELDRRVDVWALGVSLQEALTLARPFEAPSTPALLNKIANGEPTDPRAGNRLVGEDLRIVLATALERNLDRRYPTALAFAEDLRRIRLFEPILARPAGPLLRFRRWVRRHPALAASTVGTILSLGLGLVVALVLLGEKRAALEIALARHLAARAEVLVHEDPSAALALATEAVQRAPAAQTRSALYQAIDACTLRALFDGDPARLFLDLAPSPDGVHAAAALSDGTARLYALAGGAEVRRFGDEALGARVVRFAKDGAELWTAGTSPHLRRWSTATGELLGEWELGGEPQDVLIDEDASIAWVLEGTHVTVVFWETIEVQRWPHSLPFVREMRALPGRGQIVLSSAGLVPPDDPEEGRWIASYTPHGKMVSQAGLTDWVRDLVVDPNGHFLYAAAGAHLHRVRCGDFGEPSPPRNFDRPIGAVDCLEDGRLALAEFADEGASVLVLANFDADPLRLDYDGARQVVDVAFDPRGERVATASFDRSVRSFDARDGRALRVHRWPFRPREVSWTPDGTGLLTLSMGPTAHLWAAGENPWMYRLGDGTAPISAAAFSADGKRVLVGDEDGRVQLYDTTPATAGVDAKQGSLLRTFEPHADRVTVARSDPRGAHWITGGADGHLVLRSNKASAGTQRSWLATGTLTDAGWSADGEWVFGLADDGGLLVVGADGGEPRRILDVSAARFAPSVARLAYGRTDGSIVVLELGGDARESTLATLPKSRAGVPRAVAIAFRPDGGELAVVASDRSIHLLDARTGEPTRDAILRAQPTEVRYAPNGRLLLLRGPDGPKSVLLQDLDAGHELRSEIWHTGPLTAVDFSPDGSAWLTASTDGLAFVMSVAGSRPIASVQPSGADGPAPRFDPGEGPISRLALHDGAVNFACFAPDDGPLRVLTTGADGYARVWPVDPLPAALALRPRELRNWEVAREKRLADPLEYEPLGTGRD